MAVPQRYLEGGYIIYPRGNSTINYMFNLIMGEDGKNTVSSTTTINRQQLTTFGKYPGVYYVGNTFFKTFSIKTVFTTSVLEADSKPYHDIILRTAYEEFKIFENNLRLHRQWAVRGAMYGDDHICDVTITNVDFQQNALAFKDDTPDDETDCACDNVQYMDYVEVTIQCVEIDDFDYNFDAVQ